MTTATLKREKSISFIKNPIKAASTAFDYNKNAIFAFTMLVLSFLYFFRPFNGSLSKFYSFSIIFIIILPIVAFILSLISLRQMQKTHERGISLSYITLIFTSLYFITALAVPLVLLVFYFVYSYA